MSKADQADTCDFDLSTLRINPSAVAPNMSSTTKPNRFIASINGESKDDSEETLLSNLMTISKNPELSSLPIYMTNYLFTLAPTSRNLIAAEGLTSHLGNRPFTAAEVGLALARSVQRDLIESRKMIKDRFPELINPLSGRAEISALIFALNSAGIIKRRSQERMVAASVEEMLVPASFAKQHADSGLNRRELCAGRDSGIPFGPVSVFRQLRRNHSIRLRSAGRPKEVTVESILDDQIELANNCTLIEAYLQLKANPEPFIGPGVIHAQVDNSTGEKQRYIFSRGDELFAASGRLIPEDTELPRALDSWAELSRQILEHRGEANAAFLERLSQRALDYSESHRSLSLEYSPLLAICLAARQDNPRLDFPLPGSESRS